MRKQKVADLARVAGTLLAHDSPDVAAVGAALLAWVSGEAPTMEHALGLAAKPGQRSTRWHVRQRARARAIRGLEVRFGGPTAALRALQRRPELWPGPGKPPGSTKAFTRARRELG